MIDASGPQSIEFVDGDKGVPISKDFIEAIKAIIMRSNQADGSSGDKTEIHRLKIYLAQQFQTKRDQACQEAACPGGNAITVTYQSGAGAHEVGERLVVLMQAGESGQRVPWTIFDRHLLEKMLEDHHLPMALADFLPEDGRSYLQDAIDDMFGVIPPSWEVVPKLTETVLKMIQVGHVILLGHGASFISAGLSAVFRVHLVAPLSSRIERVRVLNHLTDKDAKSFIREKDKARERYLKANFQVGIDNDLLYHLVINTDRIPCPEAAQLIAWEAGRSFARGAVARTESHEAGLVRPHEGR